MTKIVQVKVVDNFNEDVPAERSLVFVFEGIAYGIDLCAANYLLAVRDFGKYTSVAQRLGPATVTAETKDGPEVVVKPRGKTTKPPSAKPAPKQVQQKQTPTKQPPKQDPPAPPATIVVAPNGQIPLPKFHEAQPAPANGQIAHPHDDDLPPDKSWLRQTDRERSGPGSRETTAKGTAYRMNMREWLRDNGWPELGNRGIIPSAAIDRYWAHVLEVRAAVAEPT